MYWTEIYRPKNFEHIIGNEEIRLNVLKWLVKWFPGTKPLLLIGPPGVGKTTIVKILSSLLNYDLIELNASDTRSGPLLEKLITPLYNNTSLFGKKILLFFDEVDGIYGREDSGGLEILINIVKASNFPIIFVANSNNIKLKNLSKLCKIFKFQHISANLLMMFLNYVLFKQGNSLSFDDKKWIVEKSNGDVRTMLNLAQSKSMGYDKFVHETFKVDISEGLNEFFQSTKKDHAKKILLSLDGKYPDPRYGLSAEERRKDIINSLFTSIVSSNLDIANLSLLLDSLSQIDLHVARINKNRNWNLLRYMNNVIIQLLYENIQNKMITYHQYGISWPVMGQVFSRGVPLRSLISKLSLSFHVSSSTFGMIFFPYLLEIIHEFKIDIHDLISSLMLDEKFVEIIQKEILRSKRYERT
ncbi:MAG: AAA family ATPase [Nitrososphaeraceae archaeon]|jgi:replication factor C large subunit|nr:AAA family ATPase [Nitrososphaeraceae archaeon]MDW3610710.1 AAA family ATPase [Nitrososphaeraceae archaeon]